MVRDALTTEALRAIDADEAAARFVARRAEGLTEYEREMLAEWLAAAASNRQAFERAERGWQAFAAAERHEILDAMRAHALSPRRRARSVWPRVAAIAAALVVIIGGGLVLRPALQGITPPPSSPGQGAVVEVRYVSARGEVKQITLPDGSNMTLDADSEVSGRFAPHGRSVELKRGRGFFAVAHDTSRPFAVVAGGRRVVAVGTRFDVDLAAGALTVTLLDGRVTVASTGATSTPITLTPGQQLNIRDGSVTVRSLGSGTASSDSWRRGLITFDDQPLAEAAAVMNRYGADQVLIDDARVGAIRISGQFRAGETSRFAQTVAELYRLKVARKGDRIELAGSR